MRKINEEKDLTIIENEYELKIKFENHGRLKNFKKPFMQIKHCSLTHTCLSAN